MVRDGLKMNEKITAENLENVLAVTASGADVQRCANPGTSSRAVAEEFAPWPWTEATLNSLMCGLDSALAVSLSGRPGCAYSIETPMLL